LNIVAGAHRAPFLELQSAVLGTRRAGRADRKPDSNPESSRPSQSLEGVRSLRRGAACRGVFGMLPTLRCAVAHRTVFWLPSRSVIITVQGS
jgi:hypothetical protein